ncbi:ras and Rab interactor 2 [Syngnathus acus]|uniref:ras and Rab interactor 2 n=1 Tax=Syngnathus acus TaxID=161584 RepID=UPI0018861972|nr:ras and Rab interactor 2 [Syngnathus acus]
MQEAGASQPAPQRALSVLDRLLLTHPVWLQLSLKQDSALYILLREPVGTFLVRKCSLSQRKVLCVRVTADRSWSSVKECFICEEDYTFALESSALSFPDLCRLVAFYCVSRDVLPFPLQLPDAIAKATTHRQLESISHMGQDFWNSPSASELQNGPLAAAGSGLIQAAAAASERWRVQGRSGQSKLCFINPLFLQLEVLKHSELQNHSASNKRHRFKRSVRLRLSESSMNLSLEGVGSYSPPPSMEMPAGSERLRNSHPQRRVHSGAGVLRRTPAVSPGSAGSEEEDAMAVRAPQVDQPPDVQQSPAAAAAAEGPAIEVALLAPERRAAPSLAELDSNSSLSSLDEEDDWDSDSESGFQSQGPRRPPLVRSRGRGGLHRMSEAFVCFFAPDKRLTRLVRELSRDRRSIFGGMVQDFLLAHTGLLKSLSAASLSSSPRVTSVQLLQGVRLFLSQAKCCLLESGELEPPIETLVPENEKDLALERAMFSCVLRPLKSHLDAALAALHRQDASSQRFSRNLARLKDEDSAAQRLGVRTGLPDGRLVDKVKQKLALMRRTHSPVDKVLLLLQVCKCVQKGLGAPHGQEVSWEDFLPSLSYAIVESNKPHILMEVEYMMELLEPSWLGGEGGSYLTSVFASLHLIQSLDPERTITGCLTSEAREALKQWRCRRSLEAQKQKENLQRQRCVRILFQDGERSAVRTLQWRVGESSQALAQLCAATFGVTDPQQYALYWRSGGEMRPLPPQAQPQDLAGHSEGGPSLSYLRTDHDFSKMRRLTRGGAVDLSESVCEE